MPPFFDRVHLHQAVNNQAVPALEAIAANDNLHSLHRFKHNDPPPYASSTKSEELDNVDLIPPTRSGPIPKELKALIGYPLSKDELETISDFIYKLPHPDNFYYTEAQRKDYRLNTDRRSPQPKMFRDLNNTQRQGIIIRHLVRRRWQKLGVWNINWGFAGRKVKPSDDFHT